MFILGPRQEPITLAPVLVHGTPWIDGTNVNAPFFKFSHQNSGTVPVLESHVETLHWGEAAKWVLRPSTVRPHIFVGSKAIYCFAHLFLLHPFFFKIASDRMKWSKYVRRKVWTHHHFVLVPMHWYSGTTCEQALGLKKMKATGAEADRLITEGRDLSGVFPVELTEEANTEKNRIPSLFLVVSYYLKPKLLHAKTP